MGSIGDIAQNDSVFGDTFVTMPAREQVHIHGNHLAKVSSETYFARHTPETRCEWMFVVQEATLPKTKPRLLI